MAEFITRYCARFAGRMNKWAVYFIISDYGGGTQSLFMPSVGLAPAFVGTINVWIFAQIPSGFGNPEFVRNKRRVCRGYIVGVFITNTCRMDE
ncbi:MAG: hypothetical protein NTW32_13920 [Chloroflexi bacterium]|nr:hypothetical protein [Chloroflexota bacterium]